VGITKLSKNVHLQIIGYVSQKKKFWIELTKFLSLLHRLQFYQSCILKLQLGNENLYPKEYKMKFSSWVTALGSYAADPRI
jgi:hypothetical protein